MLTSLKMHNDQVTIHIHHQVQAQANMQGNYSRVNTQVDNRIWAPVERRVSWPILDQLRDTHGFSI